MSVFSVLKNIFVLANVSWMQNRATKCNAVLCRIQPVKLINIESVSRKTTKIKYLSINNGKEKWYGKNVLPT